MVLPVTRHRCMVAIDALVMHAVVHAAMRRRQDQAHPLVGRIVSPGADRVQVSQRALNLFQDGEGIRCGKHK